MTVLRPFAAARETPIPCRPSIALTEIVGSILLWISLSIAPLASAAPASLPTLRQLDFEVLLDERPIGYQRFDLRQDQGGLRVETRAEFELTLLRIKAIAYDHRNVEQWRDGCLESISSQTESNGKPYRVTGRVAERVPGPVTVDSSARSFTVTSNEGSEQLTGCVGTFSYWDKRQLLGRSRLLNAQTGEYLAVRSKALGPGTLTLGDRKLAVERYLLEGEDLAITLSYSAATGEWVALDSPLFGGFTLRYRRQAADLPELAPPD